jgi:hypothetical protein
MRCIKGMNLLNTTKMETIKKKEKLLISIAAMNTTFMCKTNKIKEFKKGDIIKISFGVTGISIHAKLQSDPFLSSKDKNYKIQIEEITNLTDNDKEKVVESFKI